MQSFIYKYFIYCFVFSICVLFFSKKLDDTLYEVSSPQNQRTLEEIRKVVSVKKGDNFHSILKKEKLSSEDINKIVKLLEKNSYSNINLSIGQNIILEYSQDIEYINSYLDHKPLFLKKISFTNKDHHSINLIRGNDGNFDIQNQEIKFSKLITKYNVTVKSNLITSLKKAGLSNNVIAELIDAFSQKINFKKDIRSGNKITLIAEKFITPDNNFSHNGKIIYASIKLDSKTHEIYRYQTKSSEYHFFDNTGKTIKTSNLIIPIKFSRISSNFGYRKHPILGYKKMHNGIDFIAPKGTPIYAAGDGIVAKFAYDRYSGNFIILQHKNQTNTIYAHLSKFAKDIHIGQKIKQGAIIGYIGNTGRSTGTHLHYEVKLHGKNINPLSIRSIPAVHLQNEELNRFSHFKNSIQLLSIKLDKQTDLGEADLQEIYRF